MTSIRGPGPTRPTVPGRVGGAPEPAGPEAAPGRKADGLAAFSRDTVVTGSRTPTAAGQPPKAPTTADLAALDEAARGQFDAAAAVGKLFERLSAKVAEVAAAGESGSAEDLMRATKDMQEMNQSFNLQYLQLQQKMQHENRQFSLVSNIMKTKHDTAKSAIQNIR